MIFAYLTLALLTVAMLLDYQEKKVIREREFEEHVRLMKQMRHMSHVRK